MGITISLIIIFIIILLLLLTRLRLRVVKKADTNVDLYISRFLDLRIDIDEIIREKLRPENVKTTLGDVVRTFRILLEQKQTIQDFMKRSKIVKVTVIPKRNVSDPIYNTYLVFIHWQLVSAIRAFLEANFKDQLDEYYQVVIEPEGNDKGLSLEIQAEARVITIIAIFLRHFKPLMQIIFKRKRNKNERASNK